MLQWKQISQIICLLFDYFHSLLYHVLSWGYVGVKKHDKKSVIYTLNTTEQHHSNHNITFTLPLIIAVKETIVLMDLFFVKHNNEN